MRIRGSRINLAAFFMAGKGGVGVYETGALAAEVTVTSCGKFFKNRKTGKRRQWND